jgi:hypothetical protein
VESLARKGPGQQEASFSQNNATFAYNRPRIGSSEDDNQLPAIDHIAEILRQSLLTKGTCLFILLWLADIPRLLKKRLHCMTGKKMFRRNNEIKIKSWHELINLLQYGKFFYCSSSGHIIQKDDPEIIISSIKLVLPDYDKI